MPADTTDVSDYTDCDDSDPEEFPGVYWYPDADGDGFGNPAIEFECGRANLTDVSNNSDCDDSDRDEYPGQIRAQDKDGDGHGNANVKRPEARQQPTTTLAAGHRDDPRLGIYLAMYGCLRRRN